MGTAAMAGCAEPDLGTILRAYSDVTERLKRSHELLRHEVCRLREELHEKNRELERRERLAALGEMAAGVAHEIRNPLGGIGLYASLLEKVLADRREQRELARRIQLGVRSLENVVGDILAFAGNGELHRRAACLGGILERAMTQAAPRAEEFHGTIEVDPSLESWEVHGDARRIERALLNLLFNAIDAAGEGGRVWIRDAGRASQEGRCAIAIEDDGPGVPVELRQKVFNPFFTTKETGTGLGLAIVHRIVESHGGCVVIEDREDGGARVVLSLPLARATTSDSFAGG